MIPLHRKTIREILGRGPVHPFPARMAPGIALQVLAEARGPLRVLDPMVGSGTVLAVAGSKGHCVSGVDIDPLAVLISRAWTTPVDGGEVRGKAAEVLDRARKIFVGLPTRKAYPRNADKETRRFVTYWFDGYARRQLASLATTIHRVRDHAIRDALWCGFSRLIITKQSGASRAMDLSHSRPHRAYERAPAKPFASFLRAVNRVVDNCVDTASTGCSEVPVIREGDARRLPFADASVDLVLTSPPYLNAIDYMRCSKFSLVWMGRTIPGLRRLRSESVGAESGRGKTAEDENIRAIVSELKLNPSVAPRHESMLCRYIDDMLKMLNEAARVLVPGGKAVYVVGENTIRGTYVRNSVAVAAAAELAGLQLSHRQTRTLPANRRYLPPPSVRSQPGALNARIRREVVLTFMRPVPSKRERATASAVAGTDSPVAKRE